MANQQNFSARISWIGYIRFIIMFLLFGALIISTAGGAVAGLVHLTLGETAAKYVAIGLFVGGSIACFIYCLYRLIQFKAYTDDEGVWFVHGYFPWSAGIKGVRWENFDQVLFRPSLFSWLTGSYTVFIRDRYGNTVTIKDLFLGKQWSALVNGRAMCSPTPRSTM